MSLEFLNDARSYDTSRQCVSFWGHDSTFEVTFRLDPSVLKRMAGEDKLSEALALRAFDSNLAQIRKVALKVYNRAQKRYLEISSIDM